MPKYVAFLRAINVGGHIVKMDQLRRLFEQLNFENVETFIASGNVVFDTRARNVAALEQKVEAHLLRSLGYEVDTFVRSIAEVSAIAEDLPFDVGEGHTLLIGFTDQKPSKAALEKLMALSSDEDTFHIKTREVYWRRLGRTSESTISMASIEKLLGQRATFRNTNTVSRIAAKYTGKTD